MKRMTIQGYFDLKYVTLVDVPIRDSKYGPIIDLDPAIIEKRIAEEMILQRVPLRGREITFLRKVLGLSLEKFANNFDYTGSGVLKWERDPDVRISPLIEAGLRTWFAEQFNVELPARFHSLVADKNSMKKLEVEIKNAA